MNPFVSLFVDMAVLAVLGVTIFYCLRLSRQFKGMQADRKAFEALIQSLNIVSSRAEAVIRSLKEAAMDSGDMIQEKVGRARALSEELEIMIQAGDGLANRLQTMAEKNRRTHITDSPSVSGDMHPVEPQHRTRAEKELLEAVKAREN